MSSIISQTNTVEPPASSGIDEARADLANEITELHHVIKEVERRLASVNIPRPPEGQASTGATPVELQSELRAFLKEQRASVVTARLRLTSLLAYLDL